MTQQPSRSSIIAAVVAAAVIIAIFVVVAQLWDSFGNSEISPAGWLAMGLGIVFTLLVGVGLMALVFISNRRGFDEGAGDKYR